MGFVRSFSSMQKDSHPHLRTACTLKPDCRIEKVKVVLKKVTLTLGSCERCRNCLMLLFDPFNFVSACQNPWNQSAPAPYVIAPRFVVLLGLEKSVILVDRL